MIGFCNAIRLAHQDANGGLLGRRGGVAGLLRVDAELELHAALLRHAHLWGPRSIAHRVSHVVRIVAHVALCGSRAACAVLRRKVAAAAYHRDGRVVTRHQPIDHEQPCDARGTHMGAHDGRRMCCPHCRVP